jgi:hypothetical protein
MYATFVEPFASVALKEATLEGCPRGTFILPVQRDRSPYALSGFDELNVQADCNIITQQETAGFKGRIPRKTVVSPVDMRDSG